jgi:hypothetical protein
LHGTLRNTGSLNNQRRCAAPVNLVVRRPAFAMKKTGMAVARNVNVVLESPPSSGLCSPQPREDRLAHRILGENMKPTQGRGGEAASANISKRIEELGDWRGATLAHLRQLIHEADPDIEEEWKFRGTPLWAHDGSVCTGETYAKLVKLTFFRGAAIEDPAKLFNASLDGNTRRAIDLREGETVDEAAFRQLIRDAVAANAAARARRAAEKK